MYRNVRDSPWKGAGERIGVLSFLCGKRATNFGTHVRERSVFDPVFGKGFWHKRNGPIWWNAVKMQAETAGRKACSGRFGDVSTAGEVRLYFRYLRFHVFVYRFFHMREGAAANKKSACPGREICFFGRNHGGPLPGRRGGNNLRSGKDFKGVWFDFKNEKCLRWKKRNAIFTGKLWIVR